MTRKKFVQGFIGANTEKWRPVTIREERSVKALNSLFRKGWYLMDLEMEDLPCLAFHVSLEGERPQKARKSGTLSEQEALLHFVKTPEEVAQILVLVLTKGEKHRQRAIMLQPDEKGYRDFAKYQEEVDRLSDGWETFRVLGLENRCTLVILEKPLPSSP